MHVAVAVHIAGDDDVHRQPECADHQHAGAGHFGRVVQPLHGFDHHQHGNRQQRQAVEQGKQDFGAFVAEGLAAVHRLFAELERQQRQADRQRVGEHMAGVGKQRQRAGQQAAGHFHQHIAGDNEKRHGQGFFVARMRVVGMVVTGTHSLLLALSDRRNVPENAPAQQAA